MVKKPAPHTMIRVVILGYYDAHNAGDEAFRHVFQSILNKEIYHLEFVHPVRCLKENPDWKLPVNTDCVIVGGGDIINDYFMPSIRKILVGFKGTRLAIGVGISYPDCAGYLKSFDRVIVRSQADFDMAKLYVQEDYLEQYPDLSIFLDRKQELPYKSDSVVERIRSGSIIRLTVCIAEPCLATAYEHGEELTKKLASTIKGTCSMISRQGSVEKVILTFVPFNTNTDQPEECDLIAIEKVKSLMQGMEEAYKVIEYQVLSNEVVRDTEKLFQHFVQDTDFAICMRYHSVMFALVSGTPFIALYSTPKIGNLLKSIGISEDAPENHQMEQVSPESHTPKTLDYAEFILAVENILGIMPSATRKKPFGDHSNKQFAAHLRKLIRSTPLFPVIEPETGFQLRFLDDHHLNRLTKGTLCTYMSKEGFTPDDMQVDDILDDTTVADRTIFHWIQIDPANTDRYHEVAGELCRILFARMHLNLTEVSNYTDPIDMDVADVPKGIYEEYLHGFVETLRQKERVSLREQLSWIATHHFRNLHPLQTPLSAI